MNNKHQPLIESLCEDLQPTRLIHSDRIAMLWFTLCIVGTAAIMAWVQPFRPTAFAQLQNTPRFLFESLLGLTACILLALSALRSAVPAALSRRLLFSSLGITTLWLGNYLYGLHTPALEPSMLGKREHCYLEVLLYGLPSTLFAAYLVWRRYPLQTFRTAGLVGLSAGMPPALLMQISCMYDAEHILYYHIGPGLILAGITSVMLGLILKLRHH